jgi:4-hydroxybenzoate polyprenyltransferase
VVAAGLVAPTPAGILPPGADDPAAWGATAVLGAYLVGTVPYVKSMIRERGDRRTLAVSTGYHAVAVVAAVVATAAGWVRLPGGVVLTIVAAALLARAVLLPRRGRVRPAVIGAGEVVATVAVTVGTLLAV